jgi:hypothetical protein
MRWLLLTALVSVVALHVVPANAKTAGDLLISCEALERGLVVQGDRVTFPPQGDECWHYLAALQDLTNGVDNDGAPLFLSGICTPTASTPGKWMVSIVNLPQLIRVFTAYARRNPNQLHAPGAYVVVLALREAFPCPR